ncbi:hypothetical protein GXP67_26775 [Rhodocytophaga rosea]|uniref:Polysaccharide deacetylase family protein n=1 Tax=Rhodocytophaga rosea TaxID=2704465 RepID=A0A6C0GPN5_9BACT|nr:hypothetical protein [Rhodocytophaga rosea]QHT69991.1 hypothetical protein GXP67_26775 [Rhodocytophaga rosea]
MTKPLLFLILMLFSIAPKVNSQSVSTQVNTPAASPTMDIYLWFDTEDYLLPASDDAALRLATMLSNEGIKSTFKVVGEKARTLEKRGRQDVIDALKKHEIGYHSNWHSVHPTPAQYLSALGWEEGIDEFVRREESGVKDLERIFGQHPSCYGQPGSSWGPQSFGALQQMKIPVYLDAGSHLNLNDQPLWYGGILTIFHLQHTLRAELGGKKDLQEAKKVFLAAKQKVLSQGGGAVHIYYHPCEWVHEEFWDGVNFSNGENPGREEWKLPRQKTPQQTEVAFETFHNYLKWIKQQTNVRFLTARDGLALYEDKSLKHSFTHQELDEIARSISDSITFQVRNQFSLSAAEIFTLLNSRIATYTADSKVNQSFTLPTPVFGPSEQALIGEGLPETTWSQWQRTATDVADYIQKHKRIPSTVWLGSQGISPEAYLATIAGLIPALTKGNLPQVIQIKPARLSSTQYIAQDSEQLWGWLFPKGWHAPALMELAKLQAWTIKPAIRSVK